MKPMNDRSMKARKGKPMSSAFFPEEAHVMEYGRAPAVNQGNYPDTPEEVLASDKATVADMNKGKIKEGSRH